VKEQNFVIGCSELLTFSRKEIFWIKYQISDLRLLGRLLGFYLYLLIAILVVFIFLGFFFINANVAAITYRHW